MNEQQWDNSYEGFMDRVGLIEIGICPGCKGLTIIETVDEASQERTITCRACEYEIIFEGVKNPCEL